MPFAVLLFLLFARPSAFGQERIYESEGQKFRVETLLTRDDVIWGFDFLTGGKILFTERTGTLHVLDPATKSVTAVSGVPAVAAEGQGGLLDVRVHPNQPKTVFFTYSEPRERLKTTALARASLHGHRLTDVRKLFAAEPASRNDIHFGSRIEFDGKGHVFLTVGDRNERSQVQNLGSHIGKLIRLREDDGRAPKDNPFTTKIGAKPEVYALGLRSPQGLARHPTTGELWEVEMGPRGGDEVNLIKAGANYGWPIVTYGREYSGLPIGPREKAGMENPVTYWVPSISPSGATFYTGGAFPKWKHNLFLGCLGGTHLRRLVIEGGKVTHQEELLKAERKRIRNVRTGPDGNLYFSTDDGVIARLVPL